MHGSDARVVEFITMDSDAHTMDFLFVRTDGGNKEDIGDFAAEWNRQQSNEVNGVGAGGHAGDDT